MRLSDRWTGGVIATVGVAAALDARGLPEVPGQDVGPSVFPMVVGAGMLLCGVLIAFGVGRGLEVPDAEEPSQGLGQGLRVLIPPAVLLFYVLAVEGLGFLLTAAVMVAVVAWTLGASARLALPLALIAPFGVHAVFAKLLRVPLPEGLLAAPW